MNTLPTGYTVWAESAEQLTIAMTDFMLMFKDAEVYIDYDGRTWRRGDLTMIPPECSGNVCSMREYHLVTGEKV